MLLVFVGAVMTSQQLADDLLEFRKAKLAQGFSKEEIDVLLLLVEVVDWESKASPQSGPRNPHSIHELSGASS